MQRSRTVRLLLVALIALAAFGVAAPAANADDSYTGTCGITLSPTTVTPGETVTITATGFNAGAVVTFTSDSVEIGTAVADDHGVATFPWVVPADYALGSHTIHADGDGCTDPANVAELTVVSAVDQTQTTTDTGTLPRTGNDYSNLLRIGVLLIAAGALVVLATRKRSNQSV